jgi:hypothetical protein
VINALRRYAVTPNHPRRFDDLAVDKVQAELEDHVILRLIQGAQLGYQRLLSYSNREPPVSEIEANRAVDDLAVTLSEYWGLKRIIAAGSEPAYIRGLLEAIAGICSGQSLAGAGGGGFAVVILKDMVTERELHVKVSNYVEMMNLAEPLTVHRVTVNRTGISAAELSNDSTRPIEEFLI